MEFFYLNIILSIGGFIYFTKKTIDERMVISPQMIMWGMPILLLLYPGWINHPFYIESNSFNLIITLGLLGTLIASIFFKIPILETATLKNNCVNNRNDLPVNVIKIGALIYFLYLIYGILKPIVVTRSILGALSINRLEEYLSGGILKGGGIDLIFLLPEILYYIYISFCFYKRKFFFGILLALVLSAYYVFNANTRLPMLMPLASLVIIFTSRLPKKILKRVVPLIIAMGTFSVFAFSNLGNAIRWGRISEFNMFIENMRFSFDNYHQTELGYYDWLHHLYDAIETGQVRYDNGSAWLYYGPISVFPRMFWKSKPITSTSNRLTEKVYNIIIGTGHPITTFTIYGEGYWQMGYVGAFISPILFMAMYYFLIMNIQAFRHTDFWVAMIICQMATFFRGELPVPQFITTLFFILLLWVMSLSIRKITKIVQ